MNIFDSLLELEDHHEDFLNIQEHNLDIEPEWWLEQDLLSNFID
jgi:hypothetical protein